MDLPANLQRKWAESRPLEDALPPSVVGGGDFAVMTYNLLNGAYCPKGTYSYCTDDLLTAARRHPVLMDEIDHHGVTDVICFQEVYSKYYEDTLCSDMERRGYAGIFTLRPVDQFPADPVGSHPWTDGSATFYRKARFQLEKQRSGTFHSLLKEMMESCKVDEEDAAMVSKLIEDNRVFLFTMLRCLKTDGLVAVGNVHLPCIYGMYKRLDMTAIQAALATRELVRFCAGTRAAHVLCGDFNIEPHQPAYQLLRDGRLSDVMAAYLRSLNPDSVGNGRKMITSLIDVFPEAFTHPSKGLQSAYETVLGHEPSFTNYEHGTSLCETPEGAMTCSQLQAKYDNGLNYVRENPTDKFVATLDYIWFGSEALHCRGVLETVDEETVLPFHACPNAVFPSDHLSLKASFSFLES